MNEELHQILLSCGYRYSPASRIPKDALLYSKNHREGYYLKDYSTEVGTFTIALAIKNDPYTELPTAWILQLPEQLKGRLIPHISNEYFLCYVEQMEADWNSNDLNGTYKDIDHQIQLTLNKAVVLEDLNEIELEGEFTNYWKAEEDLFLLAKPEKKKTLSTQLSESKCTDGNIRLEYITIPLSSLSKKRDQNELFKWLKLRDLSIDSLTKEPITTHYISVTPTRLSGVKWPPMNFRDVLNWLDEIDHNARNRVIDCLLLKNKKRHIILFDIKRQDILAIYFEINLKAVTLKRHGFRHSKKSSMKHLMSVLSGKQSSHNFKRMAVIKADRDTLLSRNLSRPGVGNLNNKQIALIGCGTIGGYLADLLLRSGAGCGKKHFHLFDADDFKPHNFARHTLTVNEFGKFKAIALAKKLIDSMHLVNEIRGFECKFPMNVAILAKYDILIDATGRPPVSKRLAAIIRTIKGDKRPILIHAFNDGNGRASKVLVDDGSCCFGCLVNNPETHKKNIDLRFEGIDQSLEKHISCGSTYTPYDAAVSHITAALAQEATLNTLELKMPWTYNEHMFDGSRSKKKRLLKRQPNCPICNDT